MLSASCGCPRNLYGVGAFPSACATVARPAKADPPPNRPVRRQSRKCRHSSARQSGSFVNCRSGDRSPLAAPTFTKKRPRFEACDGFFRVLVSVPYGQSVLLHFLTPPESIDSAGRDEEHGIEHVGPEAEDRVEEREEDRRRGEDGSHEHPTPSQPDEAVVEARFHEMMMECGVPDRQEHERLDGEEIEPVGHDGYLLERVMSQEGRRERQ